ncbi:MAG: flagellar protein FliS [Chloroflexi bacterium]|nr:flagellar protein FliS [Chloroflexota bacterium]
MIRQDYGTDEYRKQDVLGASPIHLVVMAYDIAITACEKGDFVRATKAVSVLKDALNFDYANVAVGLFRLYQWCLDCIRQGDYNSALQTLRELREAWETVERRYMPIPAPATQSYSTAASLGRSA